MSSIGYQVAPYALLALLPMLAYALAVWSLDRYEREPFWMLTASFLWGVGPAVIVALALSFFLPEESRDETAIVYAPLTEEVAKGIALVLLLLLRRREIDSPVDGIVYGAMIGFGFSFTEDTLYLTEASRGGGTANVTETWLARSYLTGLSHSVFTGAFGFGLALARHSTRLPERLAFPVIGLVVAIVLHALHNAGFGVIIGVAAPVLMYKMLRATLRMERGWIRDELAAEVRRGLVRRRELEVLLSPDLRAKRLIRTWMDYGIPSALARYRFYQTATELAFAKRHVRELGDDPVLESRIDRLRVRLRELGKALAGKRLKRSHHRRRRST